MKDFYDAESGGRGQGTSFQSIEDLIYAEPWQQSQVDMEMDFNLRLSCDQH